jgi:hypothetical protein
MRSVLRRVGLACAVALAPLTLESCATSHLLRWARDEPAIYYQPPDPEVRAFVQPGGTVVALPVAFAWDVATFPFQWIWGVYPFGATNSPEYIADN